MSVLGAARVVRALVPTGRSNYGRDGAQGSQLFLYQADRSRQLLASTHRPSSRRILGRQQSRRPGSTPVGSYGRDAVILDETPGRSPQYGGALFCDLLARSPTDSSWKLCCHVEDELSGGFKRHSRTLAQGFQVELCERLNPPSHGFRACCKAEHSEDAYPDPCSLSWRRVSVPRSSKRAALPRLSAYLGGAVVTSSRCSSRSRGTCSNCPSAPSDLRSGRTPARPPTG